MGFWWRVSSYLFKKNKKKNEKKPCDSVKKWHSFLMNEFNFPATPEEYEEYCAVMNALADEIAATTPDPQPSDFQ
jgi:hypothetical protein